MLIYKIFHPAEWHAMQAQGSSLGAPVDVTDGYVHFSTALQVRETAARHFAGAGDLILLACNAALMAPDLHWEPSRGGALFPHLYRALRMNDVIWHIDLPQTADGHEFPKDLA